MRHPDTTARRLFPLFEPAHLVTYSEVPNAAMLELGMRNYWDGYFAGRAAPLGIAPAEVVDAVFYNFAPGEVARHVPWVWGITTPEEAYAARMRGCVRALRIVLGDDLADSPGLARAADLLVQAGTSAPIHGRALYAGLCTMPVPDEPVARLYHGATLLREHRGDGHIAALLTEGIGGLESHVLLALAMDLPAHRFGRIHHLPRPQIDAVVDGMRERGLVGADGWLTTAGREVKARVEARTDALAAAPWEALSPEELEELVAVLAPIATALDASDYE